MKINVTKSLGVLKPLDDFDIAAFSKLKSDVIYSCEIKKPRNVGFHRMFFAMINLCFQNQDIFNNIDFFREEMMKASGNFVSYINHKGVTTYQAKSVSFSNMDQDEFESIYESVFMTCIQIFKWTDVETDFRKEIDSLRLG